jgi:hypothetical protein
MSSVREREGSKFRSVGISASGKPDGGAAYARPRSDGIDPDTGKPYAAWAQNGMTLRDAVAIAALPGVMDLLKAQLVSGDIRAPVVASVCYEFADAFVQERVK